MVSKIFPPKKSLTKMKYYYYYSLERNAEQVLLRARKIEFDVPDIFLRNKERGGRTLIIINEYSRTVNFANQCTTPVQYDTFWL
mmetsp:Transcript_29316/g.44984  ORF Transcript_29316/g.44984 Transcript_29316/m.44984 type:complete len:84 (+) Transcript_29316:461-712(+)